MGAFTLHSRFLSLLQFFIVLMPDARVLVISQTTSTTIPTTMTQETDTETNAILDVFFGGEVFSTLRFLIPRSMNAFEALDTEGTGRFAITFFAPTDDAFAKLDAGLLADLSTDAWTLHLTEILLFHKVDVWSGAGQPSVGDSDVFTDEIFTWNLTQDLPLRSVMSNREVIAIVKNAESSVSLTSSNGQNPNAVTSSAIVTLPDIDVRNGVVHGIDSVMLPSFMFKTLYTFSNMTVVEDPSDGPWFSTLFSLLVQADLEDLLTDNKYTLLAPTDAAFSALGTDELTAIIADKELLTKILSFHVIPMVASSSVILGAPSNVETVEGTPLTVSVTVAGNIMFNQATMVENYVDMLVSNGIVHAIDTVLDPIRAPDIPSSPTHTPAVSPSISPSILMDTSSAARRPGEVISILATLGIPSTSILAITSLWMATVVVELL